jgi:hypothetical protein
MRPHRRFPTTRRSKNLFRRAIHPLAESAALRQSGRDATQQNTRRQGAVTSLWIGLAVVLVLVALYMLLGFFGSEAL